LKNQVLLGTVNAPRKAYEDAVKSLGIFMRRWPEELKSVITSRVSMDNHVPQRLKEPPQGIKTVITVSE
jgi:hypothetical protein